MRRTVLTIGVLLILAGVLAMNQGVQVLAPVATIAGLVSYTQEVTPIITSTLVSVPPTNYTYLSADLNAGMQISGTIQVEGGQQIGLYVMDEGNFSMWRSGQPANLLLAKPSTISSNFTVMPAKSGSYFFVFDNPDRDARIIVFNVNSTQDVMMLPPVIQYVGYELILIGILLMVLGLKTGRKSKSHKPLTQKCRFCKAKMHPDQEFCPKCSRSQK